MEWINVNDRLPELNTPVFFYSFKRPLIGYYKGDSSFLCSDDGDIWLVKEENITHWMPLPEPPKV